MARKIPVLSCGSYTVDLGGFSTFIDTRSQDDASGYKAAGGTKSVQSMAIQSFPRDTDGLVEWSQDTVMIFIFLQ